MGRVVEGRYVARNGDIEELAVLGKRVEGRCVVENVGVVNAAAAAVRG